jgi:hypothetical protein
MVAPAWRPILHNVQLIWAIDLGEVVLGLAVEAAPQDLRSLVVLP